MNDGEITLTYSAKENDLAMQMIKNTICDYSRVIDHSHLLIGYSLNKDVAFKFKKQTSKLIKDLDAELVESSSATFINTGKNSIGVSFLVNKD